MGYTCCVIGCGTMGVAVISGVLDSLNNPDIPSQGATGASGTSTPNDSVACLADDALPDRFIATVSRDETVRKLRKLWADHPQGERVTITNTSNVKAVQQADVVLLCCKPQMAKTLLTEAGMAEALEDKLVISILAGATIAQLTESVPTSCRVVRAMPNTPTRIREGMTTLTTPPASFGPFQAQTRSILVNLFKPLGRCRFLDEKHFDACTALAGSGPAFCMVFLEAMVDGGVMMGLPRAEALELAAQTMQGAAKMVQQTGSHPAAIKDSVTTPGGCTIAGLLALEDGKVRSTIARCIQGATTHAAGLGSTK